MVVPCWTHPRYGAKLSAKRGKSCGAQQVAGGTKVRSHVSFAIPCAEANVTDGLSSH